MARTAKIPKRIKELLQENHLLSVPQMLEIFKESGERYNKTSLYRSLEKLLEQGEICKQTFRDNEAYFELRDDHHDHALCTSCEIIIPIECSHEHTSHAIPNFEVDHHHTTVFGTCTNCAEKE